jgi:hypothetical protein
LQCLFKPISRHDELKGVSPHTGIGVPLLPAGNPWIPCKRTGPEQSIFSRNRPQRPSVTSKILLRRFRIHNSVRLPHHGTIQLEKRITGSVFSAGAHGMSAVQSGK